MPESSSTIEQDIAELEKQIEQKKATLEHDKSEKEILHDIVGQKIQTHAPQHQLTSVQAPTSIATEPPSYLSQELKDKIQAMVQTVFSKSLDEGIKEAVKTGNIAVIDAFHDILTDELYEQLLESNVH